MSPVRLLAACFTAALFSGCSTLAPPPYSADYPTLDQLKKQSLEKVAVGSFQPRNPDAPVNKISLRAANLAGPKGTFAQYLEDALIQDLREIAAYDAGAGTRIDATILRNDIDVSGFSTGTGRMDVELTVTRNAKTSLKKTYSANTMFDSSFAGAVAISKGQSEYGNLVRTLLAKVYADPQFLSALADIRRLGATSRGATDGSSSAQSATLPQFSGRNPLDTSEALDEPQNREMGCAAKQQTIKAAEMMCNDFKNMTACALRETEKAKAAKMGCGLSETTQLTDVGNASPASIQRSVSPAASTTAGLKAGFMYCKAGKYVSNVFPITVEYHPYAFGATKEASERIQLEFSRHIFEAYRENATSTCIFAIDRTEYLDASQRNATIGSRVVAWRSTGRMPEPPSQPGISK